MKMNRLSLQALFAFICLVTPLLSQTFAQSTVAPSRKPDAVRDGQHDLISRSENGTRTFGVSSIR